MVIGHKKARKKLANKLEETPLMLSGKRMKFVTHLNFLGEEIAGTLSEPAHLTLKRRLGIASHSVYEIRSVVDDVRANTLSGLYLSFLLWKASLLPHLLKDAPPHTTPHHHTLLHTTTHRHVLMHPHDPSRW